MKNRNSIKRVAPTFSKVPEGTEKIKYSITIEGEIDWNKEIADIPCDCHHMLRYRMDESLSQAVKSYLIDSIESNEDFGWNSATVNSITTTPEMNESFNLI